MLGAAKPVEGSETESFTQEVEEALGETAEPRPRAPANTKMRPAGLSYKSDDSYASGYDSGYQSGAPTATECMDDPRWAADCPLVKEHCARSMVMKARCRRTCGCGPKVNVFIPSEDELHATDQPTPAPTPIPTTYTSGYQSGYDSGKAYNSAAGDVTVDDSAPYSSSSAGAVQQLE